MPPRRLLHWPQCYNVRDLGGLPAAAGRTTRWQALIRADHLGRLTEDGRQALLDYGVRTVIDLRGPQEVREAPSVFSERDSTAELPTYLHRPLERYEPQVGALIRQANSRAEVYAIVLDHYPDCMAEVMRAIIEARPGGVVFHCHSGKDRTGMVAALLLSLAAVPAEIIIADYAESQENLHPLYEQQIVAAGSEAQLGFWSRPTATAEMMAQFLAHLDSRYGGAAAYLAAAGLSATELAQLRERLLA